MSSRITVIWRRITVIQQRITVIADAADCRAAA